MRNVLLLPLLLLLAGSQDFDRATIQRCKALGRAAADPPTGALMGRIYVDHNFKIVTRDGVIITGHDTTEHGTLIALACIYPAQQQRGQ